MGAVCYKDSGCHDPVANTWPALPTAGVPPARYSHSAAWDGSEMLIWGGVNIGDSKTSALDVWCLRKCL